ADQEEDAAVQVQGEDPTRYLTHGNPERPAAHRLHHPEGQGEHQDEIGDRQVQDEGVGVRPGVPVASDDEDEEAVAEHSQHKDQRVDDGDEDTVEVADGNGLARLCKYEVAFQ
ncbi:hypothetical protein chiPu_0022712, partial [Chiloscyllium punctatum]|nr:hypothetical protein [Chiloscyllium punctatum]